MTWEIFLWIGFIVGVGLLANKRGRRGVLWGIISAFISPLLGFILVLCMKDLSK